MKKTVAPETSRNETFDYFFPLKKVWIVSELYYPEETSTGYFLTGIAEGLADQFQVSVLCGQPTYSFRGQRFSVEDSRHGVRIHRCWSSTFNKDVVPLRSINMLTITLSVFLNCLRRFRDGDYAVVVTNPPLLPFAVLLASRIRKTRCCLIVHDVYPEALAASGMVSPRGRLMRLIGWFTKHLYKRMLRIVVLGRDMEALVKEKTGVGHPQIRVIPNWADVDFIRPLTREGHPWLAGLGLSDKFIIQYSGNIGRTHGIEQIMACAEQLEEETRIHFLFIGFGGKKLWLERRIQERAVSNVTLMDYRSREELPLSITACDVAIISFVSGMAGVSVPSRMYNVMAAGKPMIAIADRDSELALVVREENIGWVVSPDDLTGLQSAILEAKTNREVLARMGMRARHVAETKYSFEQARQAYAEMFGSVGERTG